MDAYPSILAGRLWSLDCLDQRVGELAILIHVPHLTIDEVLPLFFRPTSAGRNERLICHHYAGAFFPWYVVERALLASSNQYRLVAMCEADAPVTDDELLILISCTIFEVVNEALSLRPLMLFSVRLIPLQNFRIVGQAQKQMPCLFFWRNIEHILAPSYDLSVRSFDSVCEIVIGSSTPGKTRLGWLKCETQQVVSLSLNHSKRSTLSFGFLTHHRHGIAGRAFIIPLETWIFLSRANLVSSPAEPRADPDWSPTDSLIRNGEEDSLFS